MKKLETTIPFEGFYNSFISADIENEIDSLTQYYSESYELNDDEEQLLSNSFLSVNNNNFYNEICKDYTSFYIDNLNVLLNSFLSVNRSHFYNQIAKDYTIFYIDDLNAKLNYAYPDKGFTLKGTYKCFISPREYNFETDRIYIQIEENHAIDFIEYVVKNYKKELDKKIKEIFTSRSGFISFYENNLESWTNNYKEWDCNQISTCFELFDLEEEDINYELREYLS